MGKPDGGSAFPLPSGFMFLGSGGTHYDDDECGMSLRDYFAGQALAGILSYSSHANDDPDHAAHWAYQQADAMLAARERE